MGLTEDLEKKQEVHRKEAGEKRREEKRILGKRTINQGKKKRYFRHKIGEGKSQEWNGHAGQNRGVRKSRGGDYALSLKKNSASRGRARAAVRRKSQTFHGPKLTLVNQAGRCLKKAAVGAER